MSQFPTTQFPPAPPVTESAVDAAARIAAEQAAEPPAPPLGRIFGAAFESDPVFQATQWFASQGFPADPNYKLTMKDLDEFTDGVDRPYWESFAGVRSYQQGLFLREWNRKRSQNMRDMAARPVSSIAANFLMPTNLALTAGTGGLSAPYAAAAQAGTITRTAALIRSGLVTGSVFGGVELAKAGVDPTVDTSQVLSGALSGFTFGAGEIGFAGQSILKRTLGQAGAAAGGEALARIPSYSEDPRGFSIAVGTQFLMGGLAGAMNTGPRVEATTKPPKTVSAEVKSDTATPSSPRMVERRRLDPQRQDIRAMLGDLPANFDRQPEIALRASGHYLLDTPGAEFASGLTTGAARIPNSRKFYEAHPNEIRARTSDLGLDYVRWTDEVSLGARVVPDGSGSPIIEVGNKFRFATSAERRAMIEKAYIKPRIAAMLPGHLQLGHDFATTAAEIAHEIGINKDDASGLIRELIHDTGWKTISTMVPAELIDPAIMASAVDHDVRAMQAMDVADATTADPEALLRQPYFDPVAKAPSPLAQAKELEKLAFGDVPIVTGVRRTELPPREPATIINADPKGGGAASPGQIAAGLPPDREGVPPPDAFDFGFASSGTYTVPLGRIGTLGAPIGRVATSKSGAIQTAFQAIIRMDAAPAGGHTGIGASQGVTIRTRRRDSNLHNLMSEHYNQHVELAKASGQKPLSADDWMRQVGKAKMRLDRDLTGFDAPTIKAAEALVPQYGEDLAYAKYHGVGGADIENARNHFPHIPNTQKIDALIADPRLGESGVIRNVARMIRGVKSERIRVLIATAWVRKAGRGGMADMAFQSAITKGDLTNLRDALLGNIDMANPVLSKAQVEELMKGLEELKARQGAPDAGNSSRFKHRIDFDETTRFPLLGENGQPAVDLLTGKPTGETIAFEDLIDTHALGASVAYARQMSGASAIAEIARQLEYLGERGEVKRIPRTIAGIKQFIAEDAMKKGLLTDDSIAQDMAELDKWLTYTQYGKFGPRDEQHEIASALMNVAHISYMSGIGTGISNASESIGALAYGGFSASLKLMPAWKDMIDSVRGKPTSVNMKELSALGAAIADTRDQMRMPRKPYAPQGGWRDKLHIVNHSLGHARTWAGKISLTEYTQRLNEAIAAKTVQQKLVNWAKSGKTPREIVMRQLGFDTRDIVAHDKPVPVRWQKIIDNIKHVELGKWGEVKALNLHQWDSEAAAAFRTALIKKANELAYNPDSTQMNLWFSESKLGKMTIQLRRFNLGAWQSKLQPAFQRLWHGDLETAVIMAIEGVGAAALYMLRTEYEAVGRPDKEEFRDRRLSTDAIVKAGFARAAWSSMLPTIADLPFNVTGRQGVFADTRTSGLNQGIFEGTPVYSLGKNFASGVVGNGINAFTGDDVMTRGDFDRLLKGSGLPNALKLHDGLRILFDYENMPRTEILRERTPR